jgi:hypothetical protein
MDEEKYITGQIVSVALRSFSGPPTTDQFQVVGCYPRAPEAPMYHVRSVVDRGQRMVPENELSVAMHRVFRRAGGRSKILQLFPEIVRFETSARASPRGLPINRAIPREGYHDGSI